jgi:hypothetical protein
MFNCYEIVSYNYLQNTNGQQLTSMGQEQAKECKVLFKAALQTTQPENCLIIGRRLAKFAIASAGDAYGQVHTMAHASGKITKFFVIPSTSRSYNSSRSRMQR